MSTGTAIQWTDATWNPVVGCTRVSAGCDHCYAVKQSYRLERMGQERYAGLTVLNGRGDRHFNGQVRTVPEVLELPLHWRKPRRVFVNSMSDLFHKDVAFHFIDRVFAVMALCPQHTFQILTKRPARMAEHFDRGAWTHTISAVASFRREHDVRQVMEWDAWPLPNVWLGTSCEDQATADERIPHLLKCPAAVRFLSCEPLLGPIDLLPHVAIPAHVNGESSPGLERVIRAAARKMGYPTIDWVIVGGESGRGARPCDVEWIRDILRQCDAAGVAAYIKQLGSRSMMTYGEVGVMIGAGPLTGLDPSVATEPAQTPLDDLKGGAIAEWPEDLRVREFPK